MAKVYAARGEGTSLPQSKRMNYQIRNDPRSDIQHGNLPCGKLPFRKMYTRKFLARRAPICRGAAFNCHAGRGSGLSQLAGKQGPRPLPIHPRWRRLFLRPIHGATPSQQQHPTLIFHSSCSLQRTFFSLLPNQPATRQNASSTGTKNGQRSWTIRVDRALYGALG